MNLTDSRSRLWITAALAVFALAAGAAAADDSPKVFVTNPNANVVIAGADDWGERAYLGVQLEEETEHPEGGARVTEIVDDSPADDAGLEEGDIIVAFDGHSVRGPVGLTKRIHDHRAGRPGLDHRHSRRRRANARDRDGQARRHVEGLQLQLRRR